MNDLNLTIYWEGLNCYIDGPSSHSIEVGDNASGIVLSAEYSFWEEHGYHYDGTVHLNSSIFTFFTDGTRWYTVVGTDGDDAWGISSILSSQSTYCTWYYVGAHPYWDDVPEDKVVEYGYQLVYMLNVTIESGVDAWWLNDVTHFSIDSSGVIRNATILDIGLYALQVWVNDTYGRTISGEFVIEVRDTLTPHWIEIPGDRIFELGSRVRQVLIAEIPMGLSLWWINDTTRFMISQAGVLTNNTFLFVGTYPLRVSLNNTYGRVLQAEITIYVVDTTAPRIENPGKLSQKEGLPLSIQLYASDLSGISHWTVNNTEDFAIATNGLLFNRSYLETGVYDLEIKSFDSYLNSRTLILTLEIRENSPPEWEEAPENQTLEYGIAFQLQLALVDFSDIVSWYLNDTHYFKVSTDGIISNATVLPVGIYGISIEIEDSIGSTLTGSLSVQVIDTTSPYWVQFSQTQALVLGEELDIQLVAHDLSGVGSWMLNDTANFVIGNAGRLRSIVPLEVGRYVLNISVADPYGNTLSSLLIVDVNPIDSSLSASLPLIILIGGGISAAILIIIAIRLRASENVPVAQVRIRSGLSIIKIVVEGKNR